MRWREKNSISTSNSWKCSEKFSEEERHTAIRPVDRALLFFCREYLQRIIAESIYREYSQRIFAGNIRREYFQRVFAGNIFREYQESIHQKDDFQRHDGGQTGGPRSCLFLSVPLQESPVHTFRIDCCIFRL